MCPQLPKLWNISLLICLKLILGSLLHLWLFFHSFPVSFPVPYVSAGCLCFKLVGIIWMLLLFNISVLFQFPGTHSACPFLVCELLFAFLGLASVLLPLWGLSQLFQAELVTLTCLLLLHMQRSLIVYVPVFPFQACELLKSRSQVFLCTVSCSS